jgi:hypothetical protein
MGFEQGWSAAGPVQAISIDFKVDSLQVTQDYTNGPTFWVYSINPGLWYQALHLIRDSGSETDYSLHVKNNEDYSIYYIDKDGLKFGHWYRAVTVWDDTTDEETYYLEDLTTGSAQELLGTVETRHALGFTSYTNPNSVQIALGRAVADVEWDNFLVGEIIPEPATIALLSIGGLALIRRKR